MEAKSIVKITISGEHSHVIEDVVYFRSGMTVDFVVRWMWYFEYLAALVKVRNPHRKVELIGGPQNVLLGKAWHEFKRNNLLKHRRSKLSRLEKGVIDDDLFHFKSQDNEREVSATRSAIEQLERDEFPIVEFPEYINNIKTWVRKRK